MGRRTDVKLNRDAWTPLTVEIETPEEAEILHKILAYVSDDTEERDAAFLSRLFLELGQGLGGTPKYEISPSVGLISVRDAGPF